MPRALPTFLAAILLAGCAQAPPAGPTPSDPAQRVTRLADAYVAAYFGRYPEAATRLGLLDAANGGVTDNSLQAVERWRLSEDAWLRELRAVDTTALAGTPAWAAYGVLRELLEGSVAMRVCRGELWALSTSSPGWQSSYTSLAGIQPVGTDSLRAQAVSRARAMTRFLRTEIVNLREGLRQGFTAPRAGVEGVLRQLEDLLATPPERSPFASPARRDSTPAFRQALDEAIGRGLYPAMRAYREFLSREYLPLARAAPGVSANPTGSACYAASVRRFTTLTISADEIYRAGERELAATEAEMRALGERAFGTGDLPTLLRRLREDSAYTFHSRPDVLERTEEAIGRAKAALPRWFGHLPRADVRVVEYPEFRQRAGAAASYTPPADDGSHPGLFYTSTYQPERIPRATVEDVAYHEALPGHHLQVAIAQERSGVHPITRYFFFSGFGEGWALYAERLADEMGLYSGDLARMGMLAGRAHRAARLVIDAGIHARGWSRDRALAFLTQHAMLPPTLAQGEIDRYITWPGQATAYMVGALAIEGLRRQAEERLGDRFDIREFHDRVLANGAVTLPMLQEQLEDWIR
jgi:uncharacterized protein (DUF885 family)